MLLLSYTSNKIKMTKLNFKQSIICGVYAGAASAIINAVLFFIFHKAEIITDNIFVKPNEPLTAFPVIMASIVPAIIGSIIFSVLEKFLSNGFKIFKIVAIVLVLLSLISPFTVITGVTIAYSIVLCLMHIVVAAELLFFLDRSKKINHN